MPLVLVPEYHGRYGYCSNKVNQMYSKYHYFSGVSDLRNIILKKAGVNVIGSNTRVTILR